MSNNIMPIIKKVSDGIEKHANDNLKNTGLTLNQCIILGYLHMMENHTAPIKSIEKAFEVSQATMQGTIQRLVKKDLVSLSGDETDRRIKLVSLTKHGLESWTETEKLRKKSEEHFFSDFTEEEISTLKFLLKKLYNKVKS